MDASQVLNVININNWNKTLSDLLPIEPERAHE
ncbi:hypothetical protein EQ875_01515 [Photobacterium damselae subsp. damselae]|nr:hypothetical protein EQ875_01515 [Photobacterium damselae subsp. damselae]